MHKSVVSLFVEERPQILKEIRVGVFVAEK